MNRAAPRSLPIVLALVEEFYARSWQALLLGILGPLLFLSTLLAATSSADPGYSLQGTEAGALLHFSLFWATIGSCGTSILPSLTEPHKRYTLPATSLILVVVPMACAMLTIFLQYALLAMIMNLAFNAGWPILAPGLFAAVLMALSLAVLWSTSNSQSLQGLTGLATGAAILLAIAIWAPPHGAELSWIFIASGPFLLSISLASLACVGIGTFGFSQLRHGGGIDTKRIVDQIVDYSPFRSRSAPRPYSSAMSAQFWLEWTERGLLLPLGIAALGAALLTVACAGLIDDPVDFVVSVSSIWLAPLPLIGLLWGHRPPRGDYGSFAGSRPMTDSQLAASILKSATLGLVVSAVIWAIFMVLILAVSSPSLESLTWYREATKLSPGVLLARGALVVAAVWSITCLITALSVAARRVLGVAFGLGFALWLVGAFLPLALPVHARFAFQQSYILICLLGCFALAVAAFVVGWRKKLLLPPTLLVSLAIAISAIGCAYLGALMNEPTLLWLLLIGCALLPVPLAAAPLAVYWNRHR